MVTINSNNSPNFGMAVKVYEPARKAIGRKLIFGSEVNRFIDTFVTPLNDLSENMAHDISIHKTSKFAKLVNFFRRVDGRKIKTTDFFMSITPKAKYMPTSIKLDGRGLKDPQYLQGRIDTAYRIMYDNQDHAVSMLRLKSFDPNFVNKMYDN